VGTKESLCWLCLSTPSGHLLRRDNRAFQSDLASVPKIRIRDPNAISSEQNTRAFWSRVMTAPVQISAAGTITAQPRTYTLFEASNTQTPPSTKQPTANLRSNGSRTESPSIQKKTPKGMANPAITVMVKSRTDQNRLSQTSASLSCWRIGFICYPTDTDVTWTWLMHGATHFTHVRGLGRLCKVPILLRFGRFSAAC